MKDSGNPTHDQQSKDDAVDSGRTTLPADFDRETSVKVHQPAEVPFVDVANITEYGLTQKLSRAIRVF